MKVDIQLTGYELDPEKKYLLIFNQEKITKSDAHDILGAMKDLGVAAVAWVGDPDAAKLIELPTEVLFTDEQIQYTNKKTGSVYTSIRYIEGTTLVEVTTKNAHQPYIVEASSIAIKIKPKDSK